MKHSQTLFTVRGLVVSASSILVGAILSMACSGKTEEIEDTDASDAASDGSSDGSIPGLADCKVHEDCVGTSEGCCGASVNANGEGCGTPTLAIRSDKLGEFRNASCGPNGAACAALCQLPPQSLKVACIANKCTLVDLTKDPLTACTVAEDCMVRSKACCGCNPTSISTAVAIRRDQSDNYLPLACNGVVSCAPCTKEGSNIEAACEAGRCVAKMRL